MRNVSYRSCRENQNTHFVFRTFSPENRSVYEKIWKNILEWGRPQMAIWLMRIACWIPKATNTHLGCVILVAFPQQQWLQERVLVLRYTYIACLFFCFFFYIHGGYWLLDEIVKWVEVMRFLTTFFRHLLSELKNLHFPSRAHLWLTFLRATKTVHMIVYV